MSTVSPFSATQIGLNPMTGNGPIIRKHFKEESYGLISHLSGVHHSRKLSDMQVNYSSTVQRLSNGLVKQNSNNMSGLISGNDPKPVRNVSGDTAQAIIKMSDFQSQMSAHTHKEHGFNERKRVFNRETGRKSMVEEIFKGTAPVQKCEIFPQKITHSQMLAMTGNLAAPDARKEAPEIKKGKKWLGDGAGWEGNKYNKSII